LLEYVVAFEVVHQLLGIVSHWVKAAAIGLEEGFTGGWSGPMASAQAAKAGHARQSQQPDGNVLDRFVFAKAQTREVVVVEDAPLLGSFAAPSPAVPIVS
jgi:hypothetical protein